MLKNSINHQTYEQLVDELKMVIDLRLISYLIGMQKKLNTIFIECFGVMKKKQQISLRIYF